MKLPHAIWRDGRLLRIRWGDSEDPEWDPSELNGQIRYATGQIILNPTIRRNKRLALGTLLHEILHDVDHRLGKITEKSRRKKYHDSDSMATWSLPHATFNRVAYPIADMLIENKVELPCACETCGKKRGADRGDGP